MSLRKKYVRPVTPEEPEDLRIFKEAAKKELGFLKETFPRFNFSLQNALELQARRNGHKDWNTCQAFLKSSGGFSQKDLNSTGSVETFVTPDYRGFVWSAPALSFSDRENADSLKKLLISNILPPGAIWSFHVISDGDINAPLNAFIKCRQGTNNKVLTKGTISRDSFYRSGATPDSSPLRNIRILVSLAIPSTTPLDISPFRHTIEALVPFLNAYSLLSPESLEAWMVDYFTEAQDDPIKEKSSLLIKGKTWKCLRAKDRPKHSAPNMELYGLLNGGTRQFEHQITVPFYYSLRVSPSFNTQELDVQEIIWLHSEDKEHVEKNAIKAQKVFESLGYQMVEEKKDLQPLLKATLPGKRLLPKKTFPDTADVLACRVPIHFPPFPSEGASLFNTRGGDLRLFDFWSPGKKNFNGILTAGTGVGGHFTFSTLLTDAFASGCSIRGIEVGGSYPHFNNMLQGEHVSVRPEIPFSLNPFSLVKDFSMKEADILLWTFSTFASSEAGHLHEFEQDILSEGISSAWAEDGSEADVFLVAKHLIESDNDHSQRIGQRIKETCGKPLIRPFLTGSSSYVRISQNRSAVFDLENTKPHEYLTGSVLSLLLGNMHLEMSHSSNTQPSVIFMDETWQFLRGRTGHVLTPLIRSMMKDAFGHKAAVWFKSMSPMDFPHFKGVGQTILSQVATKIMLPCGDINRDDLKDILRYSAEEMSLLRLLSPRLPFYNEFFVDSDFGKEVLQLRVDPYSYFINMGAWDEIHELNKLHESGVPYDEGIEQLIVKRTEKFGL